MKARILSVTHPALLLAVLLSLGGCIENPADDPPELPRPVNSATVDLPFRLGNLLQLRLDREGARTRLRAVNTGLNAIDSATFLLYIAESAKPQPYHDFPATGFEYVGWVENLEPGATKEFGIIDTLGPEGDIRSNCAGWLLRVGLGGASKGSSYAGLYTGTYLQWEDAGAPAYGQSRGLIDASGEFTFSMHPPGYISPKYLMKGFLKEDGTVALPFFTERQPARQGRFTAQDGRYQARFDYSDSLGDLDSIAIRFENTLVRPR